MQRALFVSLALAIALPSSAGFAASNAPPNPYLTTTKKPAPNAKAEKKRRNFTASRCNRATIDWGDYVRCGYDYPPWALGWDSFKRAQGKAER